MIKRRYYNKLSFDLGRLSIIEEIERITEKTTKEIITKTYRGILVFVVIAGVTLYISFLGGNAAFAQGKGACAGDVQTFCSGVQPGQGSIVQCLKQNIESLSQGCKDRILEVAEQVAGANQACQDDILTFCPGVPAGGGSGCEMSQSQSGLLSPQCAAAMSEVGN